MSTSKVDVVTPPLPEAVREQSEALRLGQEFLAADVNAGGTATTEACNIVRALCLALIKSEAAAQQERAPGRYTELQMQHARKQENADGFQTGWHAALSRIKQEADDLAELVPDPASHLPPTPEDR